VLLNWATLHSIIQSRKGKFDRYTSTEETFRRLAQYYNLPCIDVPKTFVSVVVITNFRRA
jgi:hypothetical protein